MIVTVARDEGLRLRVVEALRDTRWISTVTNVTSVGEAQELLHGAAVPSVVVVAASIGVAGAADVVAAATALRSPPPVLLVAEPSTEVLRSAMRAGVRDVLRPDFEPDDLVRAFEESGVSSAGPPAKPGLTVAVFSTKGGVGTSVIASNLVVRLADRTGHAATLVDLDLASADQAIMHGLSPKWTIQDLADGAVGLDQESLRQVLLPIGGSRARLLPGPIDPALAETITAANVAGVIAAVRADAPVAVLDTASGFDDRTLTALDAADAIVVTSSLDVAALRSLTVSLQTLERLGFTEEQLVVAVTRSDSKSGLTLGDVERAIGRSIDVGVPSTRAVPRSVNEGVPLAVGTPRSSVISSVDEIVERTLEHAAADLKPGGSETGEESSRLSGLIPWSRPPRRADDLRQTSGGTGAGRTAGATAAGQTSDAADADGERARKALEQTPSDQGRSVPADDDGLLLVSQDDASEAMDDNVVPLGGGRGSDQGRTVRRRVVRPGEPLASRLPEESGSAEERGADEQDDDVDATARERDVPPLEALPPPRMLDDDEDDQPRRRRRR